MSWPRMFFSAAALRARLEEAGTRQSHQGPRHGKHAAPGSQSTHAPVFFPRRLRSASPTPAQAPQVKRRSREQCLPPACLNRVDFSKRTIYSRAWLGRVGQPGAGRPEEVGSGGAPNASSLPAGSWHAALPCRAARAPAQPPQQRGSETAARQRKGRKRLARQKAGAGVTLDGAAPSIARSAPSGDTRGAASPRRPPPAAPAAVRRRRQQQHGGGEGAAAEAAEAGPRDVCAWQGHVEGKTAACTFPSDSSVRPSSPSPPLSLCARPLLSRPPLSARDARRLFRPPASSVRYTARSPGSGRRFRFSLFPASAPLRLPLALPGAPALRRCAHAAAVRRHCAVPLLRGRVWRTAGGERRRAGPCFPPLLFFCSVF